MQKNKAIVKMLCVRCPAELHNQIKTNAFTSGKLMQEYVLEIIRKGLDK